MTHRLRNEACAGAGDLEIAIENRHGDLALGIQFEPCQHVTQSGDIECVGCPLAGAQAAGFKHPVIEMIAIHWKDRRVVGHNLIEPGGKAFGKRGFAGARRPSKCHHHAARRVVPADPVGEFNGCNGSRHFGNVLSRGIA